jgi:hypothetical protein
VCWAFILFFLIRIVWKWEGTRGFTNLHKLIVSLLIIGGIVFFFGAPIIRTYYLTVKKSFIFVAPGQALVECERRAFFVRHRGVRTLPNTEITLWDNNAKRGNVVKYAEIAPGTSDPAAPKYMWWNPASPWDEDYTITATSGDVHISQRLIVRSVAGKLQFASDVSTG